MTVAIDTALARPAARTLGATGAALYDEAFAWRARFDELDLVGDGLVGRRAIELAAEELWRHAAFLGLTCDHVESADAGPIDAVELWAIAGGGAGRHGWFGAWRAVGGASPMAGDLGGTFDAELRRPLHVYGTAPVGRARSLLGRLLTDLSDPLQIRADEFELVRLADDRFIVVLPGVTDLSNPDPGLSSTNRTVRDLDRYALPSSRSSSVDDNRYARMVWDALLAADLPPGAELLLVGHSFGADAALDLAADPSFNGGAFTVTHVVAAGYHSQPQLDDVVGDTEVLVLQNHRDAAVIAEGIGDSHAARSVTARASMLLDTVRLDPVGVVGHAAEAVQHDIGTVLDLGRFAWDRGDEVADITVGVGSGDWQLATGAAADLLTLTPRRTGR
ncbi:MAG: hypothetical protein R2697_16820 [Ilumatobacteraceae bacterium]